MEGDVFAFLRRRFGLFQERGFIQGRNVCDGGLTLRRGADGVKELDGATNLEGLVHVGKDGEAVGREPVRGQVEEAVKVQEIVADVGNLTRIETRALTQHSGMEPVGISSPEAVRVRTPDNAAPCVAVAAVAAAFQEREPRRAV